jgi:hypothetical protein
MGLLYCQREPRMARLEDKGRLSMQDLLGRLRGVRTTGVNKYIALCPGHDDYEPSLSITEADDRLLVHCLAGCKTPDIMATLGLRMADLFLERGGKECEHVNTRKDYDEKQLTASPLPPVNGVNLSMLAEAKRLPEDFLRSLGIGDVKRNRRHAVRIPYVSADGAVSAVRFRLALTGTQRFAWRRGDKATLYGLSSLEQIRQAGWVLIVEGESDCWTCWFHGIPCLGVPGKGIWRLSWTDYLNGLDVYVWQEPGAEDFTLRILESAPNLQFIPAPSEYKDISEAHIQGLDIPSWLDDLKRRAESGQGLKARFVDRRLADLYLRAKPVVEADDPLELIRDAIKCLGYGGDLKPALITYLAATSRLLMMRDGAMPVHVVLTGPSSSGKSYTVSITKKLLPSEAYHEIDAGSPHIIIYDDARLEHRVLIFGEADSLPAGEDSAPASAIRNLLQDHHLHYAVTVRDPESGDYRVREVDKPGPTVLITTSTKALGAQLMTRLFTLEIADSQEQVGAALATQAALETQGVRVPDSSLIAYQGYLQSKAPFKVIVPFANELAAAMSKAATLMPRVLRDFARLLSLVKAVTLLRHHKRQIDDKGRLMADISDYETIRGLVNEMYVDSSTGATSNLRTLVETVRTLDACRATGERITNSKLARHLNLPVMTASRRAKMALKQGWLVNREQRKYFPADYAPGEPMPEAEGLPLLNISGLAPVDNYPVTATSFKNATVNRLTPLTDGNTSPSIANKSDDILEIA